jgi:hypothetical protein
VSPGLGSCRANWGEAHAHASSFPQNAQLTMQGRVTTVMKRIPNDEKKRPDVLSLSWQDLYPTPCSPTVCRHLLLQAHHHGEERGKGKGAAQEGPTYSRHLTSPSTSLVCPGPCGSRSPAWSKWSAGKVSSSRHCPYPRVSPYPWTTARPGKAAAKRGAEAALPEDPDKDMPPEIRRATELIKNSVFFSKTGAVVEVRTEFRKAASELR